MVKDIFMKRALMFLMTPIFGLALPALAHAQFGTNTELDRLNPYEYQDVDNGQFLQFASYVLTPIGMGLEWGLMRPLHYAATQTFLAPVMSGDKDYTQFGQNNNADLLPEGTFAPPPVNFSNYYVPAPPEQTVVTTLTTHPVPPPPGMQRSIH
jgi:hypothetical protein